MKKIIYTLLFILNSSIIMACPVCERQQPRALRGIIHGGGPDSNWDYVIVWVITFISIVTLYFSIKWLIKPGEKNKKHIKYFILNQ